MSAVGRCLLLVIVKNQVKGAVLWTPANDCDHTLRQFKIWIWITFKKSILICAAGERAGSCNSGDK